MPPEKRAEKTAVSESEKKPVHCEMKKVVETKEDGRLIVFYNFVAPDAHKQERGAKPKGGSDV
jgi:hypothetical protein